MKLIQKFIIPPLKVSLLTGIILVGTEASASALSLSIFTDEVEWQNAVATSSFSGYTVKETFSRDGFVPPDPNRPFGIVRNSQRITLPNSGIISIAKNDPSFTGEGKKQNRVRYSPSLLASNNEDTLVDTDGATWWGLLNSSNVRKPDNYDQFIWRFPQPVYAFFGSFLSTAGGGGIQVNIGDQTIDFRTLIDELVPENDQNTFLGVVSDTPFRSISYNTRLDSPYEEGFAVDNFSFVTANSRAVPEPITLLATTIAMGFGFILKRKSSVEQSNYKVE